VNDDTVSRISAFAKVCNYFFLLLFCSLILLAYSQSDWTGISIVWLPEITALSEGSTHTIWIDGFFIFRYLPTPVRVPPEPTEETKTSTLPAVSLHISGPDVSEDGCQVQYDAQDNLAKTRLDHGSRQNIAPPVFYMN
jgi:hypothetical protein